MVSLEKYVTYITTFFIPLCHTLSTLLYHLTLKITSLDLREKKIFLYMVDNFCMYSVSYYIHGGRKNHL